MYIMKYNHMHSPFPTFNSMSPNRSPSQLHVFLKKFFYSPLSPVCAAHICVGHPLEPRKPASGHILKAE